MLPTAIKRKLMLTLMCALLLGMPLLLTTHPQTAFAQTAGPVTARIYTADASCSEKSTFAPGEPIHYEFVLTNTSGQPIQVVVLVGSVGPGGQVMHRLQTAGTLRPGESHYHYQETIPQGAASGTYTALVGVDYNGDTQYEVKEGSTFTVTSSV